MILNTLQRGVDKNKTTTTHSERCICEICTCGYATLSTQSQNVQFKRINFSMLSFRRHHCSTSTTKSTEKTNVTIDGEYEELRRFSNLLIKYTFLQITLMKLTQEYAQTLGQRTMRRLRRQMKTFWSIM